MRKKLTKTALVDLCLSLAVLAILTAGCGALNGLGGGGYPDGKKLSGRYEADEKAAVKDSYVFKTDGTYTYSGAKQENGTYHIKGATIVFSAGGGDREIPITCLSNEVELENPSHILLDHQYYYRK